MSYSIHGRPPEADFKPSQAADFAPDHAATHVSASLRVSNTWNERHPRCGTRLVMRHHVYKQHGTLTLMAVGPAALTGGLNALQAIIEGAGQAITAT